MPILKNAKHERFAREYTKDHNATQAAIRAGYSGKTAGSQGFDLLKKPEIASRVAELDAKVLREVDITAERVMQELGRVAFADIRDLFDDEGQMIPVHKLSDAAAATVVSVEAEIRYEGKGDEAVPVTIRKVRRADKVAALRMLAQRFKLIGSEADEALNNLAMSFAERVTAAQERMKTGGKP